MTAYGSRILTALAIVGSLATLSLPAWGKPAQIIELPEIVITADFDRDALTVSDIVDYKCTEYAALHYAMAESVGARADAAFEDAYASCSEARSYERAMNDFHRQYAPWCEAGGIQQVAPGQWQAFCEE